MNLSVAGLLHETNSFAPGKTTLEDFRDEWVADRQAFMERYRMSRTSMGGVIDASDKAGMQIKTACYFGATPSGMVTDETADQLMNEIVQSIDKSSDGVLIILHGAMVSESYPDLEGELLRRVRDKIGSDLPLAITLDLHANVSEQMVKHADIIVGYDTYPHVDAYERAIEASRLLFLMIKGEIRPYIFIINTGLLIAPEAMLTTSGPMKDLIALAHHEELHPSVLNVTVTGGFPYSDVPDAGMAILVTTDGEIEKARKSAEWLAEQARIMKERFKVKLWTVDEALRKVSNLPEGPVVFAEGSDNVGGGAPADATHILKHLVDLPETSLIVIRDLEAVNIAIQAGVGGIFSGLVGGKSAEMSGQSVRVEGKVRTLFEGRYRHIGSYMTGQWANMGKTAVIQAGTLTLILTENRVAPWDPGHVQCLGLDPHQYRIIVAKSAVAWRTSFGEIAIADIPIDTPGCCSANLQHFSYQLLRRPIWPLDLS